MNSSSLLMDVSRTHLLAFLLTSHWPPLAHMVVINSLGAWEIESAVPT